MQAQDNSIKKLDRAAEQAKKSSGEGKIATSSNDEIQTNVTSDKATIENNKKEIQGALSDIENYKSGKSQQRERDIIFSANATVSKTNESLRIIEKKTEILIDFLGNETYSRSEIGAVFKPGVFWLTPESTKEAQRLFSPVVNKLFTFADKYRGGFKKLRGEIIVTGYADATPVEPGTKLYTDLSQRLQKEDNITQPTSKDLNRKLSQLRANVIKDLLENVIVARKKADSNPMNVTVNAIGRGEQIPLEQQSATLSADDRRRRIVTFYWVVLPLQGT
ncbi:hypothetical protein GCM10028807_29920 [Spirosoma daeguense]